MGISLKALTAKNQERGMTTVLHGVPSVGKTTLAAEACKDLNGFFILGEDGLSPLGIEGVDRTPVVESWLDFQEILEQVAMADHDYGAVFIDTIDAMVPLLEQYVIGKYYGGDVSKANAYKAYYTEMYQEFDKLLRVLSVIQNKGIEVFILCHSVVDTHRAPDTEAYQRFTLDLPGGAKTNLANALVSYADNVLFARFDVHSDGKKGTGTNRVAMTQWNPSWDAKSRKAKIDKIILTWESVKKEIF